MNSRPTLERLAAVVRHNRAFRRLFAANAVSQMGDWFNVVALFSLLLDLTGKGEAVAVVLLARFVPIFFVGPAAGVVADRISRRAILVTTDVVRAALVLCLLFVRSPDQVWIAYAVMIAHAVCTAFFEPAQQATVPNLVPAEDLVLAGTLENSLWSATLAVGSSIAGMVLSTFGRDAAFVCDALSFVASAALLRGLPAGRGAKALDAQARQTAAEEQGPNAVSWVNLLGLADLREGARYVAGHARVRALIVVKACFGLTLGGVLVLLAVFGERVFTQGGGAGIATLWTARGVGSFLGPFVAFRLVGHDERGLRRGILWSFATLVVCYCAFAASPALWPAAAFLAAANAAGSTLWTYGSALLQRIVPDEVRGRVAAAEMAGMVLTMSSSTWAVGQSLDHGIAPRALMAACGLVALVPLAFWASVQTAFHRAQARDRAAV
ncbi:MAG TPA: MFS transporter [Myxococcales bacterium]|nr:MFS transporter [Myxococcales bacterium]